MKKVLITWVIALIFVSCSDKDEYRLYAIEYKYKIYEHHPYDTLRIVAPIGSKFKLVEYKDSYNLKCSFMSRPLLYRITEYKILE